MAHVISGQGMAQPMIISRVWWQVAALGVGAGITQWVLAFLIGQYLIQPLYCGAALHASICMNSDGISGDIAAVVVALIATGVLIRLRLAQALVVTIASLALLWDIGTWTSGMSWAEGAGWTILLYILCYELFSWIARYEKVAPVLIIATVVVVIGRTLLVL
jgi:hypothetical protein